MGLALSVLYLLKHDRTNQIKGQYSTRSDFIAQERLIRVVLNKMEDGDRDMETLEDVGEKEEDGEKKRKRGRKKRREEKKKKGKEGAKMEEGVEDLNNTVQQHQKRNVSRSD